MPAGRWRTTAGQDVWEWRVRFLQGHAECLQQAGHVSQWADHVNRGGGYPAHKVSRRDGEKSVRTMPRALACKISGKIAGDAAYSAAVVASGCCKRRHTPGGIGDLKTRAWLLNERHGAPDLRKDATDAGTIEGHRHVAWGSVGIVLAIRIGARF
jgi:hypothetical protein